MSPRKTPKKQRPKGPVWKGPEEDGVTQSMLSRFLVCRERFRLLVVEGLRPVPQFNHSREYGQMWHACEEGFAKPNSDWIPYLEVYAHDLSKQYPLQQEQVQKWYDVCKVQFPIYVDYWAKQKAEKRTVLLSEQVFDVPYELPTGRVVRLRGKWDDVSLVGSKKSAVIELGENKTKGQIDEQQMMRQLQFDLQTMIYLIALQHFCSDLPGKWAEWTKKVVGKPTPLRGVRYNVVRRPLGGGKGSIRLHKATKTKPAETMGHYYERLGQYIKDEPETYFMRWNVVVTPHDIERFKWEFLNPVLEQLYDWWEWVSGQGMQDPFEQLEPDGLGTHWRTPYGFYNVLAEGGSSELDEYLATGSKLGLERTDRLFKELE